MTLYRQLLIFTCTLLLALFAATWLVKLHTTRTFLEEQLESHAQDTATSLGLSISPYLADNDLATVETMIDAVFDRGYYRAIVLTDINGQTVLAKSLDVAITDIPAWFIRLIPLKTPQTGTLITAGWNQIGNLAVASHPGYAYKTLWQATLDMTGIFAITAALVLGLGALGLRLLLLPLRQVERQAEDLCRRRYTVQEKLPRTRELRRMVVAMNGMTGKIKEMFDEQAQVAERLRKNAYADALTGLGNRRYLEGQVAAGMAGDGAAVKGSLLLVQVDRLQQINQEKGYEFSDRLLRRIAEAVRQAAGNLKNSATARISGGSFVVFLPEATEDEAGRIAAALAADFTTLAGLEAAMPRNVGAIGVVHYHQSASLGQLLALADRTAGEAAGRGPNCWAMAALSSEAHLPQGEQEWRQMLDRVVDREEIDIYSQPVAASGDLKKIMHREILARISLASGQTLGAGLFIPLAERLRRVSAIDRIVLAKALQQGVNLPADDLAVNISASSLSDQAFVAWLLALLRNRPQDAPKIIFEFAEFNAIPELAGIKGFTREVKALGHAVAIDHVGRSFANFGYLKSLQPRYIKIDRAFTSLLSSGDGDSHFFIGALAGVAHSLDILVIAEGVEEAGQYRALCELNVDGVQGYYLEEPRPVAR